MTRTIGSGLTDAPLPTFWRCPPRTNRGGHFVAPEPRAPRLRWLPLLLLLCWSTATAKEAVVVTPAEPEIRRVEFDPGNPPAEMPKLKANEAAYCSFYYSCDTDWQYHLTHKSKSKDGRWQITLKPKSAAARLYVTITLWLPHGASARLIAHERGHQRLVERVYAEARDVVHKHLTESLKRGVKAEADTVDAAIKAVIDTLSEQVVETYLQGTADRAQRLSDIYDELTDHGRKRTPSEDEAIETAFEREREPRP